MEYKNDSLIQFGKGIQRLIDKKDLTRQESYEMFRQILLNRRLRRNMKFKNREMPPPKWIELCPLSSDLARQKNGGPLHKQIE